MLRTKSSSKVVQEKFPDFKRHDTNYIPASRGFRLTRRGTRALRRYVALLIIALLIIYALHEFDGSTSSIKNPYKKISQVRTRRQTGNRHRTWPGWHGIRYMFVFGDSHTDTGFNVDGDQPNEINPIGNPAFPGRTGNYGHNYVSHLTSTFNQSFLQTYNLARGDAYIQRRSDGDEWHHPTILADQVDDIFLTRYGRSKSRSQWSSNAEGWGQDDTLFTFYLGMDDTIEEYLRRTDARNMTEVELNIQEYKNNLHRIYDYGGRNFLVMAMPMLEESPAVRTSDKPKSLTELGAEIVDFDGRLAFAVQSFAHEHPDTTVFFYDNLRLSVLTRLDVQDHTDTDYFPEMKDVIKPEGYCYFYADRNKEVIEFDPLCGVALNQFYWRDEHHMTEPYHRLLARMIVEHMNDLSNAFPLEFY